MTSPKQLAERALGLANAVLLSCKAAEKQGKEYYLHHDRTKELATEVLRLHEENAVMREALGELQLTCTHDEHDSNYRPLGDTYGWCSACQTKVGKGEDIAREALRKADEIRNPKPKEESK